jgi:hypothetical protein
LHSLDLIIEPGTQVFEVHPWMIESLNREEPVCEIDQKQNYKGKDQLEFKTLIPYKESDKVSDSQLCKYILEPEYKMPGVGKVQSPSQEQQQSRTLESVKSDLFAALSLFHPVGHSKGDCHSDNEHEEGLYKIPEMQAVPFMMMELCANMLQNGAV